MEDDIGPSHPPGARASLLAAAVAFVLLAAFELIVQIEAVEAAFLAPLAALTGSKG